MKLKRDYEAEINAKEEEQRYYEGIKKTLEELQGELASQNEKLEEDSYKPERMYMLSGESGEDWKGANYSLAQEKRSTISSNLSTYQGEIGTLDGEITEAIIELEEKIQELEEEIKRLWELWAAAPEHEPDPEPYQGEE